MADIPTALVDVLAVLTIIGFVAVAVLLKRG